MLANITVEWWGAAGAAAVLVLGKVASMLNEWRKDKREMLIAEQKFRREEEASAARLKVLQDIADSNKALVAGQIAQNGKLSQVVSVNDAHHQEVIRALNATCKARPIYSPVKPKTKEQNEENQNHRGTHSSESHDHRVHRPGSDDAA